MQSERTEAFWQAFRRHEGINQAHCMETWFATPPDVADRLLAMMAAGAMRANFGPVQLRSPRHAEPLPVAGDYTGPGRSQAASAADLAYHRGECRAAFSGDPGPGVALGCG